LQGPGIDGRKILRRIFRKWVVGGWNGSSWLRIGTVAGTCECGNEPSGSVKCGEFLDIVGNRLYSQEGLCSME
jgi:hypothetical protein